MKLKELRLKAGVTQKELANVLGVTGQTLLNWENGIYEPKIAELIKLADYFNVTVDYLIDRPTSNNEIDLVCRKLRDIDKEEFIDFVKTELSKKFK